MANTAAIVGTFLLGTRTAGQNWVDVPSVYPPGFDASITGTAIAGDGSLVLGSPGAQFGTLTIKLGGPLQSVAVGSVGSAQQFGAVVAKSTFRVAAVGLASPQQFGTVATRASLTQSVGSVASAQSFGTIKTKLVFAITGVGPAALFGAVVVTHPQTLPVLGVPSAQQFSSTLRFNQTVRVTGLQWTVIPYLAGQYLTGQINVGYEIGHGPQFVTPSIYTIVRTPVTGVASAQQFGPVKAAQIIHPLGLDSAQQFGTRIGIKFRILGVPSAQAFGAADAWIVYLHDIVCVDDDLDQLVCLDQTLDDLACLPSPSAAVLNQFLCGDGTAVGGAPWNPVAAPPVEITLTPAPVIDLVLTESR